MRVSRECRAARKPPRQAGGKGRLLRLRRARKSVSGIAQFRRCNGNTRINPATKVTRRGNTGSGRTMHSLLLLQLIIQFPGRMCIVRPDPVFRGSINPNISPIRLLPSDRCLLSISYGILPAMLPLPTALDAFIASLPARNPSGGCRRANRRSCRFVPQAEE